MPITPRAFILLSTCCFFPSIAHTAQKRNGRAIIEALRTGAAAKESLKNLSPRELQELREVLKEEVTSLKAGKDLLKLVKNPLSAARVFSILFRIGEYVNSIELIAIPPLWYFMSEDSFRAYFPLIAKIGLKKLCINAICTPLCWDAANKLAERHDKQNLAPRRFALAMQLQELVDYIDSLGAQNQQPAASVVPVEPVPAI